MDLSELLIELYDRIPPLVRNAVDGLDRDELQWRPAPHANSIGWLTWHLLRVQDHHISHVLADDQLWTTGDWAAGFGLTGDASNTGFGHSTEDVATVQPEGPDVIIAYCDAVTSRTRTFLATLDADALDRIVDRRWNPPVTLGVRLVSIADDDLQHVGQAIFTRGLLLTERPTG